MLEFSEITIEDKQEMERYLHLDGAKINERLFSGLYIWAAHYNTVKCVADGCLFLKGLSLDGRQIYYMPLGEGPLAPAFDRIQQDAGERGIAKYLICCISKQQKQRMEQEMPGRFRIWESRDDFDYIYRSEDLISLKGKKYHSKRNFINRFLEEYQGRWSFEDVDPARHLDELMQFQRQWCLAKDTPQLEDYQFERCAIRRALTHYDALSMRGGILRIDGAVAAFTLAAPMQDDTIDILIEKADSDIAGAYPMINREFAQRHCGGFAFIDREEDMGIEGLRRAKLSYQPVELTEKYLAEPVQPC